MVRFGLFAILLSAAPIAEAQTITSIMTPGTGAQGVGSGDRTTYTYTGEGHGPIAARPDQVRVGYEVYSELGAHIGRIAYAKAPVAVVQSSDAALRLPLHAFGITRNGLVLAMTPAAFEKLAATYGAPR